MVDYYGPWQDGPLTTETHDASTGVVTRTTEYPVAQPYASGWFIGGWKRYSVIAEDTVTNPGGISDPPPLEPGPSQAAWGIARSIPTAIDEDDHIAGNLGARVHHDGGFAPSGPPDNVWTQSDQWELIGSYWKFAYERPSDTDWNAAVAPPFEEWPEGAVNIEVEQPGPQSAYWTELVVAHVFGTGDATWPLYHKPANEHWLGDGLTPAPKSIDESVGSPVVGPVEIPVADLDAFVVEYVGGGMRAEADPRWPSGAVVHRPEWPGVYGPQDPDYMAESPEGETGTYGTVVLSYRPPRWRYVYDRPLTEPYRRNFPRDDALAGGAGRNWPRPKSIQASNRTSGGYL